MLIMLIAVNPGRFTICCPQFLIASPSVQPASASIFSLSVGGVPGQTAVVIQLISCWLVTSSQAPVMKSFRQLNSSGVPL